MVPGAGSRGRQVAVGEAEVCGKSRGKPPARFRQRRRVMAKVDLKRRCHYRRGLKCTRWAVCTGGHRGWRSGTAAAAEGTEKRADASRVLEAELPRFTNRANERILVCSSDHPTCSSSYSYISATLHFVKHSGIRSALCHTTTAEKGPAVLV